jgi:hypothetical protein
MDELVDIGRMGENIVTNELLARSFLVTHLDKGTRGVSANADLMVGHRSSNRPALIQVRACYAQKEPNFVFLASLTPEVLEGGEPVYNRKLGFRADYIAAVSINHPKNYRVFIMPVATAEEIVLHTSRAWHTLPKRDGDKRKLVTRWYVSINLKEAEARALATGDERYRLASENLANHEGRFDLLMTPT